MTDRLKKEDFVHLLATRMDADAFWLVIDTLRKTHGLDGERVHRNNPR
ncbi:hypothetical protein ccbrp13_66110 [Ktedonobacteria bacterium brp13]|nr:hypothetical protein ccbrp13_66110 [Ktedonobacteria bacterium brp13]